MPDSYATAGVTAPADRPGPPAGTEPEAAAGPEPEGGPEPDQERTGRSVIDRASDVGCVAAGAALGVLFIEIAAWRLLFSGRRGNAAPPFCYVE